MTVVRVLTTVGVVVVALGLIATVVYQSSNLTSQPRVADMFHDNTVSLPSATGNPPAVVVDPQVASDSTCASLYVACKTTRDISHCQRH
jgi:hypothetical protein